MKSILQTPQWAEFKKSQGWEILKLGEIFVHKRGVQLGKNFLYVPEVSADDITPSQIEELKKMAKEQNSIFARLEFLDPFSENAHKMIRSLGFIKSFEEVQPKWRQIINLVQTEEEILAQMKSKGRYNIKVAQKHGVRIENGFENCRVENSLKIENCKLKIVNTFYSLYSETVKREKIQGRSSRYFENMVDKLSDTDYVGIYTASYQNEPVAAALITIYSGVASYLYGGSSKRHKEVMAPYLMHWKIIQDAKERGCVTYDMIGRSKPEDVPTPQEGVGIPTASSGKSDKWAGVTRFKEQFGGEAVEIMGSYDFVVKPRLYKVFKFFEKMRRKSE